MGAVTSTTIDAILREKYLGPIRERLGPSARWMDGDGQVLIRGEEGYEATLVIEDWRPNLHLYGRLVLPFAIVDNAKSNAGAFVRLLDQKLIELVSELEDGIAHPETVKQLGVSAA